MKRKCHTPSCENLVGERSIIGLCPRCYGSINYWHKKTPKALVKRAQQLQLYRGRMDLLMPTMEAIPYKRPKVGLEIMPGEIRKGKKRKAKKAA